MTEQRSNRWVASGAGGASLMGTALVLAALFPVFVSQSCPSCVAFNGAAFPAASLAGSPDAWAVVWIIGILAATSILFLAGVATRRMAMMGSVVSLASLGLSIFEGVVAFPRLFPPGMLVPDVPVSFSLGPGYFVFLIGSVVAVAGATAMLLVGGEWGADLSRKALAHPPVVTSAASACLASLAVGVVGVFLPFTAIASVDEGFIVHAPGPFSATVVGGLDGRVVLALLVTAGIAAGLRLAGRSKPLASGATLLLSLAAAALVSFDSLHAATRVLGWPYTVPVSLGPGYYLVQSGSATAVVLALLLVAADRPSWRLGHAIGLGPRAAAHPV